MNAEQKQDFNSNTQALEFDLVDFLRFAYGHRRFLAIFSVLVFVGAAIWALFLSSPIYRSHATISINFTSKQQSFSINRLTNWVDEQELLNKITITEKAFNSESFQRALLAEIEGTPKYCKDERCKAHRQRIQSQLLTRAPSLSRKLEALFTRLELFSDTGKYLLTIQGSAHDPDLALALTDMAATTLVEMNYETLLYKNSRLKQFLEDQTEETRHHLEELELQLVDLQKNHDMIFGADTQNRLSAIYLDHRNRLNDVNREKAAAENLIRRLETDLREIRKQIAAAERPSFLYLSQLQKRFDLLQYQKELGDKERDPAAAGDAEVEPYKKLLSDPNTRLITTDPWEHIRKMEGLLIDAQQSRDKAESQIAATENVIKKLSEHNQTLPEVFRQISDVQRNIQVTSDLYSILKTRLQETRIQEAERANDLSVLATAERPLGSSEMSPRKRMAVAAVFGPTAAMLLLLLYYLLIPMVRNARDLENLGIRVIGRFLPFTEARKSTHPLVMDMNPEGYLANSIRYARFKLEEVLGLSRDSIDKVYGKVVSLSSTASQEGKTFTSANMGLAMAAVKYKVLLLDLDVGRKDLRNYFQSPKPLKVESVIPSDSLIVTTYNVRPNLTLMEVSFPNQDHLQFIESPNFISFLNVLKAQYDLIIMDSPPIDGHLEPFILSRHADAVLFVINQRAALKDETKDSFQSMAEATHGPILGILNFTLEGFSFLKRRKKPKSAHHEAA